MNAGFTSVKIKSEAFRPLFIKCENDFEFIFLCLKKYPSHVIDIRRAFLHSFDYLFFKL